MLTSCLLFANDNLVFYDTLKDHFTFLYYTLMLFEIILI